MDLIPSIYTLQLLPCLLWDPSLASDLPPHSLSRRFSSHSFWRPVCRTFLQRNLLRLHSHSLLTHSHLLSFFPRAVSSVAPPPFSRSILLSLLCYCFCCCFLRCIPLDIRWKTLSQSTSPQSLLTPATTDILPCEFLTNLGGGVAPFVLADRVLEEDC